MANDNNDDDDLPIKYKKPVAKPVPGKIGDGSVTPFMDDPVQSLGDRVANAGSAVADFFTDKNFLPMTSKGGEPGQPDVPIKYEHSGDAKDMGPPSSLRPDAFRPTLTGKDMPAEPSKEGLPDKPEGENYDRIKNAIKGVESAGRYDAVNKDPENPADKGALGAYQFRPGQWDKWVKQNFGHDVASMIPQKSDSPDTREAKEQEQDKVFAKYYEDQMVPWIKQARSNGLGQGRSDAELAALFHNQGGPQAEKILQGKADEPKDYVRQVATAAGVNGQIAFGNSVVGRRKGNQDILHERVSDSGSKNLLGGVNIDDVADTHLQDSGDPAVKQTAYDLKAALATGDRDDFKTELSKIRADFADVKDTIAKRELAHTIADALTKMAGGAYGMKTHVDMSHINTGEHDFQKDTALAQNEYKTNLDDLKGRREEDLKAREGAADMAFKQDQSALGHAEYQHRVAKDTADVGIAATRVGHEMNYQDAMADYHRAAAAAMNEQHGENRAARMAEAKQKLDEATQAGIVKVLTSKEIGKDEDRAAAIAPYLAGRGLKSEDVFNALHKKGLIWGTNVKDTDEMGQAVFDLLNKAPSPQSLHLLYKDKDGKPGHTAFTDPAKLEQAKALIQSTGGQVIHG